MHKYISKNRKISSIDSSLTLYRAILLIAILMTFCCLNSVIQSLIKPGPILSIFSCPKLLYTWICLYLPVVFLLLTHSVLPHIFADFNDYIYSSCLPISILSVTLLLIIMSDSRKSCHCFSLGIRFSIHAISGSPSFHCSYFCVNSIVSTVILNKYNCI